MTNIKPMTDGGLALFDKGYRGPGYALALRERLRQAENRTATDLEFIKILTQTLNTAQEARRLAEAACRLMWEWKGQDSDFVEIDQALVAWKQGVKHD